MTPKKFDTIVHLVVGRILLSAGFKDAPPTYYRKISEELYHVVSFHIGRGGWWFDIAVFPTSPLLDPNNFQNFPNSAIVPVWEYFLNDVHGVSDYQQQFQFKGEDELEKILEEQIVPLLPQALNHLKKFSKPKDMIPHFMKHKVEQYSKLLEKARA